jgi:hypothetical protein
MAVVHLLLGALFGFLLVRIGASDFQLMQEMFLFKNMHLMGVIGLGIVVAFVGVRIIRKYGLRAAIDGRTIELKPKAFHRGTVYGGVVFGIGWALTGGCPGTILAQVGEGKLAAVFSLGGVILGTYLFAWAYPWVKNLSKPRD